MNRISSRPISGSDTECFEDKILVRFFTVRSLCHESTSGMENPEIPHARIFSASIPAENRSSFLHCSCILPRDML